MEPKPLLAVSFLLLTWIGFSLQQPYVHIIHDKDTVDFTIAYNQRDCCNMAYMAITGAENMLSNFTATNTESGCHITTTGPIDFSKLDLYQKASNSCVTNLKTEDAELTNSRCKLSVHLPLRTSVNQIFRPYICDETCSYKDLWKVTINETTLGVIEKINRCDLEPDATDDILSIEPHPGYPISLGIHSDDKFFYIELLNYADYDNITEKVFNFTLVASNSKNPNHDGNSSTLMVVIRDVDDLPPKFTEDIYTCNIAEGVTRDTNCSVDAKDGDKGINDTIYYKIISVRPKSAEHDYFMINNATGKLEVKGQLDREKEPLYYLHIQAFESKNPNHFADAFLVVNVTDIDDHRPLMDQHYNVSIVENLPKGSMVTIISASDQDIGENAIITYSLKTAGNSVNGAFEINNSTGVVTVNKPELIDRETNPHFTLIVFAQSSTKMKSNASLFIRLVDENDNSPAFNASHFSINITETAVGIISQITATDPDQNENGKLVYSFVEQVPSAVFNIDPQNGSIYLMHSIVDIFEEVYHITVKAEDQAINATKQRSSRSSVIPVTIYVTDINNNRPKINSLPNNISIPEDLPTDTILLVINATDKDPTDNLKLSLHSLTPQPFKLDGNLLKINGTLDREATANYQLIVQVSDGVHNVTETITVTVLDINDNVPMFNKSIYNFTVQEENKTPTALGKLTATDVDAGMNSNITYFIDSTSPWASNFTINNHTGILIPLSSLDREALSQPDSPISFTVFVQDGGVPALTSTTVVHITITDINDHIPTFIGELPDKLTFDELTTPQDFLTVMASDPDYGGNGKVVYAISSNAPDIVKINHSSGTLSFAQQLVISEQCNNETITVNISACNPGSPRYCSYHPLEIYVWDVDNHLPTLLQPPQNKIIRTRETLFKEALNETLIVYIDNDCLPENKRIFYWVSEATNTIFLNETEMKLYANREIDADLPRNDSEFYVTIYASNYPYNTSAASSVNITIQVSNFPDSPYRFDQHLYEATIPENTTTGICFFKLNASNHDLHSTSISSQFGLQNNQKLPFDIDNHGCLHVNRTLDYETQQFYQLTVELSTTHMDDTDSCLVLVNVTNVNDNPPQFLNQPYEFKIDENNLPSAIVGQVSAIDDDHDILTFSIVKNVKCYSINATSGIIMAVDSIDLENKTVTCPPTLTVMVDDGLYKVQANVSINVVPVNDNSPVFKNKSYTWTISENTNKIVSVQAEDADLLANGSKADTKISYSIKENYHGNISCEEYSGNLTIIQLDRESLAESGALQITVLAVDNGVPPRTGAALVTIKVQGTNDNPPIYSPDVTHLMVYLNEGAINPHILQSHATDADIGPGSSIFYHLASMTSQFSINTTTGILSNNKGIYIDHSNNNTINITIDARNNDAMQPRWTASQNVTVIILDVNNHRPEFNQTSYTANVSECLETGKHILSVKAVDPDPTSAYNTVRYWLDPRANESHLFKLDTMTGELVLLHTLDVDFTPSQATLMFKVYASDLDGFNTTSNHTHSSTITINVSPCNDNAPVFSADHYNCTIMISQGPDDFHCNVSATDVDKDHIVYTLDSILTVDGGPWFAINTSTGQISLKKIFSDPSLAPKSLLYKVVANDTLHTAEALLIISLVDVNDVTPQFEKNLYKISVKESYPVGMLLNITIAATDSDIMDKGNLMYEIYFSAGNVSDVLKMDSRTAQPYLLKPLDYDDSTPNKFNVTIKVNDTAGHVNSTVLQVTILDVNDNAPKFTENEYTFTLSEGKTVLGQNFSVNASDADSGVNAQLTYNITMWSETEVQSYFNITQEGYVQIVKPLDREDHQAQLSPNGSAIFELFVTAQDHGEPPLSASTKVVIVVTDVNDCVPTFAVHNYSLSVEEGSDIGLTIATITATDCDVNPAFNNVTYTMSSANPTDKFNITSSGNIVVNSHLSYKVNGTNVIHFDVEASDGHNNNKTTVTINVLDTNDHSPVFGQDDYYFKVNETDDLHMDNRQSLPLTIGQLVATDADEGDNGQIVFEITSGNENDTFFLNQVAGLCKLQTNKSLDHETTKQYILTITATDSAEIGNRSTVTIVTVEVLDRNDHRPVFNQHTFRGIVMETSPANTSVVLMPDISVSDADSLWFGTQGLHYSLNSNPGPFAINPDDGTITVLSTNSLNRTQNSLYSFQIVVKDSNGTGWNDTAQVNITVIGLRDIYQFNVSEFEESLSVVGNVSAIDADIDNGYSVIYSLEMATDPPRKFIIDAHSGVIRLAGKLDRENITDYNLTAVVRYGNISDRAPVLISVIDVNDNAPQISGIDIVNIINVDIIEQQPAGPLYTVSATDLDQIGTNNSKISFSIPSDLDSIFYINENNGTIFTRNPLDREIQSSYLINVTVTDHGLPPLANFAIINVTVLDINDNYPSFYSDKEENITSIDVFIVEKSPVESVIAIVRAHDPDAGINGTIEYKIGNSKAKQYFKIGNATGQVIIAKMIDISNLVDEDLIDANETDTALLIIYVLVQDKAKDPKNATLIMNIHVEKINDNAPFFTKQVFNFTVKEEQNATVIGNCTAKIANATNPHMKFFLLDQDDQFFKIDEQTGELSTNKPIDREKNSDFMFSVKVSDNRTPERVAFALVKVNVEDINDNSPEFINTNLTLTVMEEQLIVETVVMKATDKDVGSNANVTYSLGQHDSLPVDIDSISGILTINGTFDRETKSNFDIVVIATDGGSPERNSTMTIPLVVQDANDHPPVFHLLQNTYPVSESTAYPHEIFIVNTTDGDEGWNARVIYSLYSTEGGPFDVDPFNGSLLLTGPLDYETRTIYHVVIIATDEGNPPLSSNTTVVINVTDTYDFVPHFSKDVYEINVPWNMSKDSPIVDLNATDELVTYTMSDNDKTMFRIDATTGKIFIKSSLNQHEKYYILTVTATDKQNQTATCRVIVFVEGHFAVFPKREYRVVLEENKTANILIDLNTTEELAGQTVLYSIVAVQPKDDGAFIISSTGVVSCVKELDRELHQQYILYISAVVQGHNRKRRAIEDNNADLLRLVVNVTDINDNPPSFPTSQKKEFWVPFTAKANFIVTTLKAEDKDNSGSEGLSYKVIGGSTDVFAVDYATGELLTIVAIASTYKESFGLQIVATDGGNFSSTTLNITIRVLQRKNQVLLTASASLEHFKANQDFFLSNMSRTLGVTVELDSLQPHTVVGDKFDRIELDKVDLTFHALNNSNGEVINAEDLLKLMNDKQNLLSELFNYEAMEVQREKTLYDPSAITATQIGLICIAIFILFGSSIALVVLITSSSKYEEEWEEIRKLLKENDQQELELELDTLRSHQSKHPSACRPSSQSVITEAYLETQFNTNESDRPTDHPKPKTTAYEEQELMIEFAEEPLPGANDIPGTKSIADSGVGNTIAESIIASSESARNVPPDLLVVAEGRQGEAPAMTSSPRLARSDENYIQLLDVVETETVDDEEEEMLEINEEESGEGVKGREENKDKAKGQEEMNEELYAKVNKIATEKNEMGINDEEEGKKVGMDKENLGIVLPDHSDSRDGPFYEEIITSL